MSSRLKRYSINLDDSSHDRCKNLAHEMSTSVSGVVRILIRDAFEERERSAEHTSVSHS
jgi:predicted DNA-binding protein